MGLVCLNLRWAGGRPRRISEDDEAFFVATATSHPRRLGRPFIRWSLRKLTDHLAGRDAARRLVVSPERLRQLLHDNDVSWLRTRTWKEFSDPDFDAKLDRIEQVTNLSRTGVRLRPVRAVVDPPAPRQHVGAAVRDRSTSSSTTCRRTKRPRSVHGRSGARFEWCLNPTSASWANPIEAQFGPLRTFVMAGSDHPNHTVQARELQRYLNWRNADARHPDVLAAQRREPAGIRSERRHRWGRPRLQSAA
ncbi:hypothetical protein J2S41_004031 [Catenuloplanes atrovinosus]|uniref:Transposase n=1 Tax=Catenuloplanes atrovinosus TaxID=137266 RepID=A0AAE3YNU4_9ACTN|nr:hypothetical protein [Catenuloplanes atrovinosus]